MNEKLLQYIWKVQYFNRNALFTPSGEKIQIIYPGTLNQNQGPDFTDARIKIGNTLLAGSVELHIKTSHWELHGHQSDPNYNNVILHVVFEDDSKRPSGIPILELQPLISTLMIERYRKLEQTDAFISCSGFIHQIREITWISWKDRLIAERLTRRTEKVYLLLEQSNHHWEEMFWWMIAGNFGIKVNAEAFEALARTLPVRLLSRHKNQIHQLEALLFGQAGLLENDFEEEYPRLLQREYRFFQKKYHLVPIAHPIHFLRMRPGNFPSIRLAQLAMLIHVSAHLFSTILEIEDLNELIQNLKVTANDYWHYHYLPDRPTAYKKKTLGDDMINNLIINSFAPILFAYGLYHKEEKYKQKAMQWLEQIQAEQNTVIKQFADLNIKCKSAYDSQALLELKTQYCDQKQCLKCAVGNEYLKANEPM
jgi:hypothetical protein